MTRWAVSASSLLPLPGTSGDEFTCNGSGGVEVKCLTLTAGFVVAKVVLFANDFPGIIRTRQRE